MHAPDTRRPWALASAAYLLFAAAALSPAWTGSREPIWDGRDLGYPAFAYLSDSLRHGRFPLWDPFTNCGYPFYSEPGLATSPLAALAAVTVSPPSLAYAAYWTFHWALGGAGMLLLVAALGGGPAGALAAGALYALSGFQVANAQHVSFVVVAGFLPWTLALAHLAVARRRAGLALLAAASLGLCALGGYPALIPIAGLFVAVWLALAFLTPLGPEASGGRAERARWVLGTLAVMAAVLAIVWSPALHAFFREGAGYTDRIRSLGDRAALSDNPLPVRAWVSLLYPFTTVAAMGAFRTDVSMSNAYAGALAVPLAAYWVAFERERRRPVYVAVLALLFLLAAAGGALGVRTVLNHAVPVFAWLRHNGALRLFWILCVTAAAGCGLSRLARVPAERRQALAIAGGWALLALPAGAFAVGVVRGEGVPLASVALPLLGPAAATLALGIALVAAWPRTGRAAPALAGVLAALALADAALHLGTNSFTAWGPKGAIATVESLPRIGRPDIPRALETPFGPMNAHLVVQAPVVEGYVTMQSDFNRVLARSSFGGVLSGTRYWIAPAAFAAERGAALSLLASTGPAAPVPVFVDGAAIGAGEPVVPGSYGAARIVRYEPERVDLEVDSPGGGILASTERMSSGWRVRVDGAEAPPVLTNFFFRGVALPPGRHAVSWTFEAGAFWWLAALSALTLLGAIAGGAFLELRRRT